MENKKKTRKQENEKKEEKDDNKLTIYDKFAIIATIVLLVLFSVLLYILYQLIRLAPNFDPLTLTYIRIEDIRQNINRADNDEKNIQDLKYVINSLENTTNAGLIYQKLVNYSLYDQMLFGIQGRSSICRDKIHHKVVNQYSKLLTKMITLSGHKFPCTTEYIKSYLPLCYFHDRNNKHFFNLVDAMTKTGCSKEVYQSLIRVSKQGDDFYLKFKILQFFDQHSNWEGVKFNTDNENEDLICSLSENAIESLPANVDQNVQNEFCTFAENHKCEVFSDQSIVELCQKEAKDDSL